MRGGRWPRRQAPPRRRAHASPRARTASTGSSSPAVARLHEHEELPGLASLERLRHEVVDGRWLAPGVRALRLEPPLVARHCGPVHELGHPDVAGRAERPAGGRSQRAGDPGLARAGGAGDDHAAPCRTCDPRPT